jgi:hypothetical protein
MLTAFLQRLPAVFCAAVAMLGATACQLDYEGQFSCLPTDSAKTGECTQYYWQTLPNAALSGGAVTSLQETFCPKPATVSAESCASEYIYRCTTSLGLDGPDIIGGGSATDLADYPTLNRIEKTMAYTAARLDALGGVAVVRAACSDGGGAWLVVEPGSDTAGGSDTGEAS